MWPNWILKHKGTGNITDMSTLRYPSIPTHPYTILEHAGSSVAKCTHWNVFFRFFDLLFNANETAQWSQAEQILPFS